MTFKKLHFHNPTAAPAKPPSVASLAWTICCKVWKLVLAFGVITLGCAALYYVGSERGWGIQATFTTTGAAGYGKVAANPEFLDCLHFSIVTIATLGYGDYRPESYGRLIAAGEVISGIVLMGMFVASLVSRQQDRLMKRLVTGQLNREIQDFRDALSTLLISFRSATPVTVDHASEFLFKASGLAQSIARYWRHEAREPDLAEIIQTRAAGRLLGGMITLLETIDLFIAGKTRFTIHGDDRKHIRRVTESVLTVATVLNDRVEDAGVAASHERVVGLVKKLRAQFLLHQPW